MKILYIVRHAKSDWSNPKLSDYDRPLNKRGKKNAPEMGEYLKSLGVCPDLVVGSSAKRAYKTAKEICQCIGYKLKDIQLKESLYHGSVQDMVKLLKETDSNAQSVMLFGHNPGLTDLSNFFTDEVIDNIPTCGVVCIEFAIGDWQELGREKGKVSFFVYPKKLPMGL